MKGLLYAEINLFALIISILYLFKNKDLAKKSEKVDSFVLFIISCIGLFAVDTLFGLCDAGILPRTYLSVYYTNFIFFILIVIVSFLFFNFCENFLNDKAYYEKKWVKAIFALPVIAYYAVLFTNSKTSLVFFVDSANNYHRGAGTWFQQTVTCFYLVAVMARSFMIALSSSDKAQTTAAQRLMFFMILPLTFAVISNCVEGAAIMTIGIACSLVWLDIYIRTQSTERILRENLWTAQLVKVLVNDYASLECFDVKRGDVYSIRPTAAIMNVFRKYGSDRMPYEDFWKIYVNLFVFDEDKDFVMRQVQKNNLLTELSEKKAFVTSYRVILHGRVFYYRLKCAVITDEQDNEIVVIGFKDIDHEMSMQLMATTDQLTKLMNRNGLEKYVEQHLPKNPAEDENIYFMLLDGDQFKRINDTYGHSEGDKALAMMASIIAMQAQQHNGIAVRYGGDEFLVICKGVTEDVMKNIPIDINSKLDAETRWADVPYKLAMSAGIAKYTGGSIEDTIARADTEMYDAKRGRTC